MAERETVDAMLARHARQQLRASTEPDDVHEQRSRGVTAGQGDLVVSASRDLRDGAWCMANSELLKRARAAGRLVITE